MKFKKVEISAFRIYNKPEDSIFDFTVKDGETADFVSLYAPNGFGKTSFYDAVEWGMTNSISRFTLRDENEKLYDTQNSSSKQYFLRNTDADDSQPTKVTIHPETGSLKPNIFRKRKNARYDISLKEISHDFQRVILSQEWISAFLTEVKGDRRYSKFTEFPDLKEYDTYRKNILALLGELEQRKRTQTDKINNLKSQLNKVEDPKLLDKTNAQITKINNDFGFNLSLIKVDSTDQEILNLKNEIISLNPTQTKLSRIEESIQDVSKAINGSDKVYSIKQFFKNSERNGHIKKEIVTLNDIIDKFNQLSQKKTAISNLSKQIESVKNEINEVKDIDQQFEEYSKITQVLSDKGKIIKDLETKIKSNKTKISEFNRDILNGDIELESLFKRIAEKESILLKIPELAENLSKALEQKAKILEQNVSIQEFIKLENINLSASSEKLSRLNVSLKNLRAGEIPLYLPEELSRLTSELELIESNSKEMEARQISIKSLEDEIQKQQELNSTIEDFIKQGLEIANQTQTSACPLCENDYGSFQELAKKITGNQALSQRLQELLSNQSNLKEERSTLEKQIDTDTTTVIKEFESLAYKVELGEKDLLKKIDSLTQEDKNKNLELKRIDEEIAEVRAVLNGEDANVFRQKIRDELDELILSRTKKSNELDKVKSELSQLEKDQKVAQSQINLLNDEIVLLKKDLLYTKVKDWIEKKLSGIEDEKDEIKVLLGDLDSKIKILTKEETDLKQELENLNSSLQQHSQESSKLKIDELRFEQDSIQKGLDSYLYHLKNIEVTSSEMSQSELLKLLESKVGDLKSEYQRLTILQDQLELLSGFIENIKAFLQAERIKSEIKNERKELDFLKNTVQPKLVTEKKKVVEYLELRIEDFFQTELINQLYNKIDPHPEYKKVNFVANFETDTPRLDVFVNNGTDKGGLIPNLYFSTAQINILSLSIFLATALTAKDYDCIFIDDPVQSMDSINVLSTIDLLRSLCTQYDKQIILSTHDENFHRLLKKKIPSDLFKSKFLELESFGKVKYHEQH